MPTIPSMKIIKPDKNQIDIIRLVKPGCWIFPLKWEIMQYKLHMKDINVIENSSFIVKVKGFCEYDNA